MTSWKDALIPNEKRMWWLAHGWMVDDVAGMQRPGKATPDRDSQVDTHLLIDPVLIWNDYRFEALLQIACLASLGIGNHW